MFRLEVVRDVVHAGRAMLVGDELHVDAKTARELIQGGVARLVNAADLAELVRQTAQAPGQRQGMLTR
jgi:hypothetical protein